MMGTDCSLKCNVRTFIASACDAAKIGILAACALLAFHDISESTFNTTAIFVGAIFLLEIVTRSLGDDCTGDHNDDDKVDKNDPDSEWVK